jgi:hypothetical protein
MYDGHAYYFNIFLKMFKFKTQFVTTFFTSFFFSNKWLMLQFRMGNRRFPHLVLVQVRGRDGEAPVHAVHVQNVALVVHELHLHALNVDGPEVHALIGLQ